MILYEIFTDKKFALAESALEEFCNYAQNVMNIIQECRIETFAEFQKVYSDWMQEKLKEIEGLTEKPTEEQELIHFLKEREHYP